jgi:Ribonuclease G/E
VKGATRPNLSGERYIKKSKEALSKIRSLRENFIRRTPYGGSREKKIRADLGKAGRIWKKVGERFKWWGSLP